MVINEPEEYKVRRKTFVGRKGNKRLRWVGLRKGVAYLSHYRDVSLAANRRYLDALAVIEDQGGLRVVRFVERRDDDTPAWQTLKKPLSRFPLASRDTIGKPMRLLAIRRLNSGHGRPGMSSHK